MVSMPTLTPEQVKKRGVILQQMADSYWEDHPYLKRDEAYLRFAHKVETDVVLQRTINGMAAMGR